MPPGPPHSAREEGNGARPFHPSKTNPGQHGCASQMTWRGRVVAKCNILIFVTVPPRET
jgi:hypothetical protein